MSNPAKTILCVDDHLKLLELHRLVLESEGYIVLTAASGADAISLFVAQEVDLVILDYLMPVMDGGAVAAEMKARKPSVPIIMLSAVLDIPVTAQEKVDLFITKGGNTERLLHEMRVLLDGAHPHPSSKSA